MILTSQKTMYATNLEMNMLLGINHKDLPNTTLNEKFSVMPLQAIPSGVYPKVQYLAIGIGGTDIVDNTNYKFSTHSPIDAALFEHVPFIMRPVTSDLQPMDKANYRLRVVETYGGVQYACYYLKTITTYVNKQGLFQVSIDNGNPTISYFDSNSVNLLTPTPRVVSADYLDMTKNKYYARTTKLGFTLYANELEELQNVFNIKYGTTNKVISEIAVCTGIENTLADKSIEASNVTVAYFVGVDLMLQTYIETSTSIIKSIEIGGIDPSVS